MMEKIDPLTVYIAGRLHAWAMLQDENVTIEQNVREAQEIIARILQAVVDGMPLPGEFGRAYTTKQGWERHDCPMWATPKELEVIALHKEERK